LRRIELTELILVERRGGIAIVTINAPLRRNALSSEVMIALDDVFCTLSKSADCRAVVLTGAPPAFCAGSDLKELGGLSIAEMCTIEKESARIARRIRYLPFPVIVAVEGYALGGGFILAISCDVVVSARSARWDMPEVRNGWLPPWGLLALSIRIGPTRARLATLGIVPIDGLEAYRIGIADEIADDGAAVAVACDWALRIAALPVSAVRSTKRFFAAATEADAESMDAEASRFFAADCLGAEAQATFARFAVHA
jgi:enoyl-CoA hydratase/carnithine racemase